MSNRKRTSEDQPAQETSTAVAEPPAAANDNTPSADDNRPSFAERVGQRKRFTAADPFGIAHDNIAGVRLFESRQDRQMAIKFGEGRPEDKPSQTVIDKLKDAGFRWQPENRVWAHPVWPASAMTTRINAERLYQDICTMIRQEKGAEASKEVPF